jgi:hypothetical protein
MLDKKLSKAEVSLVKRLGGRGKWAAGVVESRFPESQSRVAPPPLARDFLFVPIGAGE